MFKDGGRVIGKEEARTIQSGRVTRTAGAERAFKDWSKIGVDKEIERGHFPHVVLSD